MTIRDRLPVVQEVSAGGVVARRGADGAAEVCLIATRSAGGRPRWQLPKGLVEAGEAPEATALREVREETGLVGVVVAPLERIEYWYVWGDAGKRTRRHKVVHFFLLDWRSGTTDDHDHEVEEARWFPLAEAIERVAFRSERGVLEAARARLAGGA